MIGNTKMAGALLRRAVASVSNKSISANVAALFSFTGGRATRHISCSCTRYDLSSRARSSKILPISSSIPTILPRHISSTSFTLSNNKSEVPSSADIHSLYHEQMKEIKSEREFIFGASADDDAPDSPDLSQTAKEYFASKDDAEQQSSSTPPTNSPPLPPNNWNAEEAYAEREAIFAFSEEEKSAWTNHGGTAVQTMKSSYIDRVRELMREKEKSQPSNQTSTSNATNTIQSTSTFSHLTPQGDGVSMVDVGHKSTTHRVALARSVVVFPPELLSAFQVSDSEMIGPKGPIFETAKIAGIMGAKKTSDLIPLCHPLPLDRVNINIQLVHNQAIIECECRVTHKTGVEMEALTGATIAALTIYDMVKAVSHRVEIGQTVLVSKSGGKSDFVHQN